MARNPVWPDEQVELLRKLLDEGLSLAQIAGEMGLTRNAVSGKVDRLNLRGHVRVVAKRVRTSKPRPQPPKLTRDERMNAPLPSNLAKKQKVGRVANLNPSALQVDRTAHLSKNELRRDMENIWANTVAQVSKLNEGIES